ncbi:MAG: S41 family peptidase [Verrucomicrobiota bacterium]
MKKRLVMSSVLLFTIFIILGTRAFDALAVQGGQEDSAYDNLAILTRALQLIRQDYVDDKKVGYRDLTYAAMRGMLQSLDPHSQFMEPKDFKGMQEETDSQFGGLGVVVSMKDGVITIISPMEDTPGFKAGLLPGDQIVKVNGSSTEKMQLSDVIQRLRGKPGEKVTLTVLRPSTKEIKDFTMERAIIKVDSVKDAKILPVETAGDFKIGYVRITQFNKPTGEELAKKLNELEALGMQALVLDLRYNPGGLLDSAVKVCGEFLPPNQMVVYTEGRVPSQKKIYRTAEGARQRAKYPVAILVNGSSASASEIVAGALKDLNRAVLVGETTFGKGSVQSVIQMPDGSALRLTTARYFTPGKQVIHEKGVTPNIHVSIPPDQEKLLLLKRREELLSEPEKKELVNFHDPQLERAVDALKGVMIYTKKPGSANEENKAAGKIENTTSVQ